MPAFKHPFSIVIIIWIAGICAAAQFAKIAIPFQNVANLYPGIGAGIGWLLTLVSVVGAVLGFHAGAIVARFGAQRVLILGLVAGGLLSLWQATLPGFSLMLASRLFEGASHLAIVVAAPTLMSRISSERMRSAAMALWSTFFGVSFAMVAWLGMPLVAWGGLTALFTVHGAAMLVVAAILAIILKPFESSPESPAGSLVRMRLGDVAQAYRSPFIAAPGAGWLFYAATYVALLTVLPQRLPDGLRLEVAGVMPLASIVVSMIVTPILLRILDAAFLVILGFCGAIGVIAAFSGVPLSILCIALFLTLGLVQGASFASVPELNGSTREQAISYGLMAQTGNIGNLIGTPFFLLVLSDAGEAGVFAAAIAIYVCAAGILMLLRRKRAGRHAEGPLA